MSTRNSKSGKTSPEMNLLFDSCFPSAVPLLSRGWIVPVGGATPDRLKAQGRRKVRPRKQGNRNRRAEIVSLTRSCLCRSRNAGHPCASRGMSVVLVPLGNAGRPCAGRGLNPRPESSTPAKCPPAIPKPERHLPEMNLLFDSCFPSVVPLLSRGWIVPVGGSTPDRLKAQGRRKVRPRKQRNRNRRAEIVSLTRSYLCRSRNADRPCAGWGMPAILVPVTECRSGVEPPTGKLHPRQMSPRNSKSGKTSPEMNLLFDSCFPSAVPLLSRGWIVPVGGATPDRLRAWERQKCKPSPFNPARFRTHSPE